MLFRIGSMYKLGQELRNRVKRLISLIIKQLFIKYKMINDIIKRYCKPKN